MNGREVLMSNNDAAKVTSKGSIQLQFTSSKKIVLVLHVPDIENHSMSGRFLYKKGFKTMLESQKIILEKIGLQ